MRFRAYSALLALLFTAFAAAAPQPEPALLFYVSGSHGTTADFSAGGTPVPNFDSEVSVIHDGASGPALRCGDLQRLTWWAPGNVYAQRGTVSFFWRPHTPVGPTPFPVFRVGYAEHSSWDMVFLRIDYNGHGFDAFVTDRGLARTRVSYTLDPFPAPETWSHLVFSWDENRGVRLYVNGKLAAAKDTVAVYDAALDQFGPHSRIISPWNVQSDYNYVRGGDIDELRIYDGMVSDAGAALLASGKELKGGRATLAETAKEWAMRYGWDRPDAPPPYLEGPAVTVRKVEIHDAYDLKRWWWKATDGIAETTWPGVYNRSRLPGRNDYFQLPDWDCYSLSGKSITFWMPPEKWNHVEITGSAYGPVSLVPHLASAESKTLFVRPAGEERTIHVLAEPITGRKVRFDNVRQEEPIGEFSAYYVHPGAEPAGSSRLSYSLSLPPAQPLVGVDEITSFVSGRFGPAERQTLVAVPEGAASGAVPAADPAALPIVHIVIPADPGTPGYRLDAVDGGLDGIAIDLPGLPASLASAGLIPLNLQVKDPLWPLRDMLDFTFSVKPGEPKTLWLDLRDRILPAGKAIYLTIASASPGFGPRSLASARLRLVFKPKADALSEDVADRFTQAKDAYAMLVEEHPNSDKLHLWTRFAGDIKDLMRVAPDHNPGRNYYAAAFPGKKWPAFEHPATPAGVPLWAFRQVEDLGYATYFVNWWIDHRQVENGEFGGGLSDDTDLTNMWPGVALMGVTPDKISDSIHRELEACYREGMFTNGLCSIQADELHGYEEGINSLGQNLIVNYGSPRLLERAMETSRGIAWLTAVNPAGHRLFQSAFYNGIKMATDSVWGVTKSYSYLILQPQQLLVEYNGSPAARKVELELADGLLAHRHQDPSGRYVLPSAIYFADDREANATRRYFPWPLFWSAYKWTGDRKYLDPIFDGGANSLEQVNANLIDLLDLRREWTDKLKAAMPEPDPSAKSAAVPRSSGGTQIGRGDYGRWPTPEHFAWQLTGDKHYLEQLYDAQIREAALGQYISTEGSLWIDRVGAPYSELQRARLGGVALTRNNTFPGHVISWRFAAPATAQSVAILVTHSTAKEFTVVVYNLEQAPVAAELTGWNVDPGAWEFTQGIDTTGSDHADQPGETKTVSFGRSETVPLSFVPRATTVLSFRLKTPGVPYWERPDLGLDPEDVVVNGREVLVRVHSLGSVAAPASTLVFRDRSGQVVSTETVPALEAPNDLFPRWVNVRLTLPDGVKAEGGEVELDPEHRLTEITRLNNTVRVSDSPLHVLPPPIGGPVTERRDAADHPMNPSTPSGT